MSQGIGYVYHTLVLLYGTRRDVVECKTLDRRVPSSITGRGWGIFIRARDKELITYS